MVEVKLTRREWAAALGAGVTAPAQSQPTGDDLAEAVTETRQRAERLEKFKLPMTAEPAFIFKP